MKTLSYLVSLTVAICGLVSTEYDPPRHPISIRNW